jgi:methionine synthase II (cobalamin-independent)
MPDMEFGCLATAIGSMPQTNPQSACAQVVHYLKDIPAWPQLPRRSFRENMYVQYSEGFPGVVLKESRIHIDRTEAQGKALEELYSAYLRGDSEGFGVGYEYAAGLHTFLAMPGLSPLAVKGQVTGPVTWGLTVTDEDRKAIIYDDVLGDAVPKFLRLKASWQEKALKQVSRNTIIFIDEPYMAAYGSVGVALEKEKIVSLLDEVFEGISGIKGVHCCGNTDWSLLLETKTDIVSYDTYNFAGSLSLYPEEVRRFLERKGAIAWGIVPNDADALTGETVASLKDRLEEAMAPFTRKGIRFKQLIEQGLLTPSCTLASLDTEEAAGRALELLAELSREIRKKYI